MLIKTIRKNMGVIVAVLGFFLLCIITFGDLGDFMTEEYWSNVRDNLMAIGYMSIALTLIQTVIKQGIAEQALQKGLNTDNTKAKYIEHRELIQSCTERFIYIPYFLQIYNERQTKMRKREFLVANNFTSEKLLYASNKQRLIRKYECIRTDITVSSIKWATTEIIYDKHGRIIPLSAYKRNRLIMNVIWSLLMMIGVSFLTKGLFFDLADNIPIWQKFVKLFTYVIAIGMGSVMPIIKNYEKGAFSVPNELAEINEIWQEFKSWSVPEWVMKEIEEANEEPKEVKDERRSKTEKAEATVDGRTNIQEKQEESKDISNPVTGDVLALSGSGDGILSTDDKQLGGEYNRDTPSP